MVGVWPPNDMMSVFEALKLGKQLCLSSMRRKRGCRVVQWVSWSYAQLDVVPRADALWKITRRHPCSTGDRPHLVSGANHGAATFCWASIQLPCIVTPVTPSNTTSYHPSPPCLSRWSVDSSIKVVSGCLNLFKLHRRSRDLFRIPYILTLCLKLAQRSEQSAENWFASAYVYSSPSLVTNMPAKTLAKKVSLGTTHPPQDL